NVAENSGGAHCLKYGFTTNHVTGAQLVTPAGDLVRLGGRAPDPPGYDLLGAFVGSEGTLGIATEVTLRLTRLPQAVRTLLAGFGTTDAAGTAPSRSGWPPTTPSGRCSGRAASRRSPRSAGSARTTSCRTG